LGFFLQMIRLMPSRRTTLQCSHNFLIEGLTFMNSPVRRDFHQDPVTGKNADEVLSHFAADVRKHLVLVLKLNPEHGIGQ